MVDLPTEWQESELMFRNNGLLHHIVIIVVGLLSQAQCWQTTSVHPHVLRCLSLLSLCALAQHSVTRKMNFSTRACPAPVPSATRAGRPASRRTLIGHFWLKKSGFAQEACLTLKQQFLPPAYKYVLQLAFLDLYKTYNHILTTCRQMLQI